MAITALALFVLGAALDLGRHATLSFGIDGVGLILMGGAAFFLWRRRA
jgi:hypothetical protein